MDRTKIHKTFLLIFVAVLAVLLMIFLKIIPSFGLEITENNKASNYLQMDKDIYYNQTRNDCAPYSVMCVINVLKGIKIDPEILIQQTRWRNARNLTFPQGLLELLHKNNIETKDYNLCFYSTDKKITWLKNQIDNGSPVILLVKVGYGQHYFTVIGYDETGFMLYDSSQEKLDEDSIMTKIDREEYVGNRYYTNEELIGLWDKGGYILPFKNWAIVCN